MQKNYAISRLAILVVFAGIVVLIDMTTNTNSLIDKAYTICAGDDDYCNPYLCAEDYSWCYPYDICTSEARTKDMC